MQINTEYWGESSTWLKDTFFWSTNATYTDDNLAWYNANNRTFETNTNIQINTPIDYSICYAAHAAAEKMPLADIEVYDYTASKVVEQKENAGFFFCDIPNISTSRNYISSWNALKNNITADINVSSTKRWLEQARRTYNDATNVILPLRPVVQFGIKSFFLDIRLILVKNDYSDIRYVWLKELENNISQYANEWHIEQCIGRIWSYSGKTGNNFNDFTQNTQTKHGNIGGGSIAIDKNLKIVDSDKVINNYCAFLSNGFVPIFGTGLSNIRNYRNLGHYGILINRRNDTYYQYYDESYALCMASAADLGVSVYPTTDGYGYPVYLLNPKMSITAENCEKLRKGAAAYGLFFTDNDPAPLLSDPTNTTRWIHENMYCGILDENGVGHGEYTKGIYNVTNDVFNYDNSSDSKYDPKAGTDPNTYSNTTGFNSISGGASATQRYVLNDSNVRQLLTDLWTITHNIADVDYDKFDYKILDSFLVTDPISSIVSLKRFPFDIPHTFVPSKTNVHLGKNEGTARGYLTYDVFNSVSFSGVRIYPKFGRSFLDFAPYTEYELYIPFCSTVKLNASEILDHVLSVRMNIDLISGVCVAYIMADDLCIETVTGAVSSDMQIAGTDSATADAAIQNAVINHISARTNKEVSMLSPMTPGGLMSVVMNPVKQAGSIESAENSLAKANYDITHINTPVHSMGSAGGLSSWIQEFNCRLIIYYPEGEAIDSSGGVSSTSPKLADLTAYAHNTGFACVMNGTVSQYHGLTVGNIDTSSIQGASEEERNMIKTLFSQGVWLP